MDSESRYIQIPCTVLMSNGPSKRKDGQPFVMYWKNRRNAKIATQVYLKAGYKADPTCTVDTETMSVVTDASIMRKYYSPIENVSQRTKRKSKRLPKGLRYARKN